MKNTITTDELVRVTVAMGEALAPMLEWLESIGKHAAQYQEACGSRSPEDKLRITAANTALASVIAIVALQAAETAQRIHLCAAPQGVN